MSGSTLQFARPEWAYYVLPGGLIVIALVVWAGLRLARSALVRFAPHGARRIAMRTSLGMQLTKTSLTVAAWASICVGLARPQWGHDTVNLPRGGADIIVLLDVSNSMLVEDMGTSRLEWARRKIEVLLDELEKQAIHRVGLMPFAGEPFMVVPPTPDYAAVRFFLEDLNPRSVAFGGSALSRAIDAAAEQIVALPGADKAILVVSDGEAINPNADGAVQAARSGSKREAIEAARDARLKALNAGKRLGIYALGIGAGAAKEVVIPNESGATSYVRFRGESGTEEIAVSALDESTLAGIAYENKGYVHSTKDDTDVSYLLRSGLTSGGETLDEGGGERSIPVERFRWPLLAAFALLFVELFVPRGRRELLA